MGTKVAIWRGRQRQRRRAASAAGTTRDNTPYGLPLRHYRSYPALLDDKFEGMTVAKATCGRPQQTADDDGRERATTRTTRHSTWRMRREAGTEGGNKKNVGYVVYRTPGGGAKKKADKQTDNAPEPHHGQQPIRPAMVPQSVIIVAATPPQSHRYTSGVQDPVREMPPQPTPTCTCAKTSKARRASAVQRRQHEATNKLVPRSR